MASAPIKTLTVAVLSASLLAGCSSKHTNKENLSGLGAAVGAVIGAAVGDDNLGSFVGASLGMIAGSLVGGMIGEHLDEHDRLKAEVATLSALQMEEDTKISWESDENTDVKGTVETKTVVSADNRVCKKVTQIININGKEQREVSELCQKSDGSWALS